MDENIPQSKDDVLRRIAAAWDELGATVAPLSEAQMTARPGGQWSVKDNLAHLAEWEGRVIALLAWDQPTLEYLGLPPDTPEGEDTANINAIIWERHKDDPLPDVLERWRGTHAELLRTLEPFTYQRLLEPHSGLDGPLGGVVVGNTYAHYPEHRQMISDVLRAQDERNE